MCLDLSVYGSFSLCQRSSEIYHVAQHLINSYTISSFPLLFSSFHPLLLSSPFTSQTSLNLLHSKSSALFINLYLILVPKGTQSRLHYSPLFQVICASDCVVEHTETEWQPQILSSCYGRMRIWACISLVLVWHSDHYTKLAHKVRFFLSLWKTLPGESLAKVQKLCGSKWVVESY